MKALASLAATILVSAGIARAQPSTTAATMTYTCTWQDTGNHNGVLEPGESALLGFDVAISPVTGPIIPYSGGPAPTGTLSAIGAGFVDVVGSNAHGGTFNFDRNLGYGLTPDWDPGQPIDPVANGAANIQWNQLDPNVFPLFHRESLVSPMFTMLWTPSDFTARVATFEVRAALPAGSTPSMVFVRWRASPVNYQYVLGLSNFIPVSVPIVPAPPSLALLGLAGLISRRPARRHFR
jgi:hypothetical protein